MDSRYLGKAISQPEVTAALEALAGAKPWDRVIGHFAAPRLTEWATRHYGPVNKKARWWGWLLRKRGHHEWRGVPGDDHVEYREKDGIRYRISQPYHLAWDELRGLVHHCEEHGLKAEIHSTSWYFHGRCLAVVLQVDGRPAPGPRGAYEAPDRNIVGDSWDNVPVGRAP